MKKSSHHAKHKHHMKEHANALKAAHHHHKEGMKALQHMVKSEKAEGKAMSKARSKSHSRKHKE